MKKIVLWLMSTLTVLVLLFGYHTSTSSQAAASAESSAVAPVSSGTGATSGAASGTTSSPSAAGSSSTATSTTFTGASTTTRWGPVQVEITVANGTITDVSVVDYPNNNGKDQQINARALPVLVQETLKAQSAKIDMVSGATVTSDGYVTSLQSALDQAGL